MIVYLLVNQVNCKCYVGQHKGNSLASRWTAGLRNVTPNPHFASALAKYGAQAFSREILAHCSTQEQTDNTEKLWIAVLRTYDPKCGYNKQLGGLRKAARHSQEVKRQVGHLWTEEQRQRMAETTRLQWQRRSPAERARIGALISQRNTGRPSLNRGKKRGPQKHPCIARPPKTETTRQNITQGLLRYWARKRELTMKKPVASAHYQPRQETLANRKQIGFTSIKKGGTRYGCCI